MTESSQDPAEAGAPEPPSTPWSPADPRPAFATFGVALPAPAGPATPPPALARVRSLRAAAAVMDAQLRQNGAATAQELAAAEERAGILFDAAHVESVRTAALEQARAEHAAELEEVRGYFEAARRELAEIAGAHRQVLAVRRLCEGRRGDDLLTVAEVAVAAEAGTTALDGLPMTLAWTGAASLPDAHDTHKKVVVECLSSYGGRAALTLTGAERTKLASLLDEKAGGSEDDLNAVDVAATLGAQDDLVQLDQAAGDLIAVDGAESPADGDVDEDGAPGEAATPTPVGLGCGAPATVRYEGYSCRDGSVYGSLDVAVSACDEHAEQARTEWLAGMTPYRTIGPVDRLCGERFDFTTVDGGE
ncbi:hypothetical protein ACIP96_06510 [Streptomyces nigra]|uniref:hypothetical protein n=1 Tax=Streptomyces nigra TaxID=1827580 RepID=UPI00381FD2B0